MVNKSLPEYLLERRRKYRLRNWDRIRERERLYYSAHCEERKEQMREYSRLHTKERWARRKQYYIENPSAKVAQNVRRRIWKVLRGTMRKKHSKELLGCNLNNFVQHIESQWVDGMSWENYGLRGWHIDHIIPCCSFDLTDLEQQEKCFHYTNLQPLWAEENHKKLASDLLMRHKAA